MYIYNTKHNNMKPALTETEKRVLEINMMWFQLLDKTRELAILEQETVKTICERITLLDEILKPKE